MTPLNLLNINNSRNPLILLILLTYLLEGVGLILRIVHLSSYCFKKGDYPPPDLPKMCPRYSIPFESVRLRPVWICRRWRRVGGLRISRRLLSKTTPPETLSRKPIFQGEKNSLRSPPIRANSVLSPYLCGMRNRQRQTPTWDRLPDFPLLDMEWEEVEWETLDWEDLSSSTWEDLPEWDIPEWEVVDWDLQEWD